MPNPDRVSSALTDRGDPLQATCCALFNPTKLLALSTNGALGSPTIDDLGDPGWQDSDDPWVPDVHDIRLAYDVWSRPGEVYVHHGGMPDSWGPEDTGYMAKYRISVNDGTGWRTYFEWGDMGDLWYPGPLGLAGYPDGRLLTSGLGSEFGELSLIDDGTETLLGFMAYDVFVVSDDLAYAVSDMEYKIVRDNGANWGPLPVEMPFEVSHVWADATDLFAVGSHGTILSLEDGSWRVHDTGTLDSFAAVWGFGADDVWAGSYEGGLYHWDGQTWTTVPWPDAMTDPTIDDGIVGMWGADGVVYFHTTWQLVRIDESGAQSIAAWPCQVREIEEGWFTCEGGVRINAMWGNSPEELFLAVDAPVDDAAHDQNVFLLWYDGESLHWF